MCIGDCNTSDLVELSLILSSTKDIFVMQQLELAKFIQDRAPSMTESDLENSLVAFNLAGDEETINSLEKQTMACMEGLDITTIVNLMYFYGKQRSGSKHFIDNLIQAV
jgi:hypothetical protein